MKISEPGSETVLENQHIPRRFRDEYPRPILFRGRFLDGVRAELAGKLASSRTSATLTSHPDASERNDDDLDPVPSIPLPHLQSLLHPVRAASLAQRVSDLGKLSALRGVDAYGTHSPG